MRLEDYPTEPQYTATVLRSEEITAEGADAEVRELVLEVDKRDFDFEIGQSVGVLVEGTGEFGRSVHHRLYTVADTPTSSNRPSVTDCAPIAANTGTWFPASFTVIVTISLSCNEPSEATNVTL